MLTYETIQKIGVLLGLSYTSFNGVCNTDGFSDGDYAMSGMAKVVESVDGKPPLLIFTSGIAGHRQYNIKGRNLTKSLYVLNLNTLQPTKNSYQQIKLPTELQKIIFNELHASK
jgi:hypothetical protein